MYVMLSGTFPFFDDDQEVLVSLVKKGKFDFPEENWKAISKEAKDLVVKVCVGKERKVV
jgi:calcium-dependent protein kinase